MYTAIKITRIRYNFVLQNLIIAIEFCGVTFVFFSLLELVVGTNLNKIPWMQQYAPLIPIDYLISIYIIITENMFSSRIFAVTTCLLY